MKRVFVFEYLSGGGAIDGDTTATEALMPLGLSMRDAVAGDLLRSGLFEVSVAVCESAPARLDRAASSVCARQGETMLAFVAREAVRHDVCWIVAPETGGLLARFESAVGATRWLGCDRHAIAITTSKAATLQRLAACCVATPLAFEHDPAVMRWVVKPHDGAGTVDTRVHALQREAVADAQRASKAGAAMVVEPWVDGEALSLSLLCGADTAELLSINRQRIAVDVGGRVSYAGVEVNALDVTGPRAAALQRLASDVHQAIPGLRGFIGIDLVWHAQRGPVVIEVNPRVTCAYIGLSATLGRNLAAELVQAHGAFVGEALHALA